MSDEKDKDLKVHTTPMKPQVVVQIDTEGNISVWMDDVQVRAELHNYAIDFPLAATAVEYDQEDKPYVRILL